jgi:hypothetical protein
LIEQEAATEAATVDLMSDPDVTRPPSPRLSLGFELLRDLARGRAGSRDLHRFYAAAADARERNPGLSGQWEDLADRRVDQS